jgi:hypothetical protein
MAGKVAEAANGMFASIGAIQTLVENFPMNFISKGVIISVLPSNTFMIKLVVGIFLLVQTRPLIVLSFSNSNLDNSTSLSSINCVSISTLAMRSMTSSVLTVGF